MKNINEKNNLHFDKWAPNYELSIAQKYFFDPIHRRMIRLILNSDIKDPFKILDVGCGTGRLLRTISKIWPNAQLTGIDLSETMINTARELAPNYKFHISPAEKLPLEDQTFDIVLSSLTLHHWNNAEKGVQEIVRVLRPGGAFCLADHLGPKWAVRFFGPGTKTNYEIKQIFKKNGLEIISKSWFFGWVGIRFAKKY
jgi:ubiquinone/menaquinone biosynthesis C-methylase UbiE